ncbi:fimbrial protein [Vibrio sp.]|uniref:fimbrial protein n=1 Tax=Vibrio sp. TaxID=678 RepID=UPI003AA87A17
MRNKKIITLAMMLMLVPLKSYSYDIDITISGEIYIPPCSINNDTSISVDFGKVVISSIDGVNNAKTTTVPIKCPNSNGLPFVKISGPQDVSISENILKTNIPSLGIALYMGSNVDSSAMLLFGSGDNGYGNKITTGLTGDGYSGNFTFTAVPHLTGLNMPESGVFNASALMSIVYK